MNKRIIITGTVCALIWCFVSFLSFGLPEFFCKFADSMTLHLFSDQISEMQYGFYYDIDNDDMPTAVFLILFFTAFSLLFYLIRLIEKEKNYSDSSLKLIIGFAVVFRLILIPSQMIHENDIYRYLWDGKSFKHGINPFKYAPSDLFMYESGETEDFYDSDQDITIKARTFFLKDEERMQKLIELRDRKSAYFNRIGHWQVPTIYPPVAQFVFFLSAIIGEDSIIIMKLFFFFFDLGNIFLIVMLLRHFNKNPCMSIIYAWSPLVLKEFANSGHYDPVPIFFTLWALYMCFKRKRKAGFFFLSLAALSKFFSGVLVPILSRPFKRQEVFLFLLVFIFSYFPFFVWDRTHPFEVFEGLKTYNDDWAYNSSIFALVFVLLKKMLPYTAQTYFPAKLIVGLGFIVFLTFLSLKKSENQLTVLYKCFLAISGLFIINPVGDPWYFCWAVPFLCFFPFRSWILLSGLLMISYINFHSDIYIVDKYFWGISVVSWIIYTPFFIYLIIENYIKPEYLGLKSVSLY